MPNRRAAVIICSRGQESISQSLASESNGCVRVQYYTHEDNGHTCIFVSMEPFGLSSSELMDVSTLTWRLLRILDSPFRTMLYVLLLPLKKRCSKYLCSHP
mmetsp:Transcript_30363/g.75843  ORF Transcript_30363/g.75843 Transcript_30363/m.75843 type:complete len:101 (+) Transcript_30363:187-489(+)